MHTKPEDDGELAYVVVMKRVNGDTPKLCKVSGMQLLATREDADIVHSAMPEGVLRDAFEVREVLVTFRPKE